MAEQTKKKNQKFDFDGVVYDAGVFSKRAVVPAKPKEELKKVHITPSGRVHIGKTLLDMMLESAGIDKQKIINDSNGEPSKQHVHALLGIGEARRGSTYAKNKDFMQPFIMVQIWEDDQSAIKEMGDKLGDGNKRLKKLHFAKPNLINVFLMRNYNDLYKQSEGWQPFYYENEEDIPILALDSPVEEWQYDKKKTKKVGTGNMIGEWQLTRTDYPFDQSIDLNPNNGAIRVWGNEGIQKVQVVKQWLEKDRK